MWSIHLDTSASMPFLAEVPYYVWGEVTCSVLSTLKPRPFALKARA